MLDKINWNNSVLSYIPGMRTRSLLHLVWLYQQWPVNRFSSSPNALWHYSRSFGRDWHLRAISNWIHWESSHVRTSSTLLKLTERSSISCSTAVISVRFSSMLQTSVAFVAVALARHSATGLNWSSDFWFPLPQRDEVLTPHSWRYALTVCNSCKTATLTGAWLFSSSVVVSYSISAWVFWRRTFSSWICSED